MKATGAICGGRPTSRLEAMPFLRESQHRTSTAMKEVKSAQSAFFTGKGVLQGNGFSLGQKQEPRQGRGGWGNLATLR